MRTGVLLTALVTSSTFKGASCCRSIRGMDHKDRDAQRNALNKVASLRVIDSDGQRISHTAPRLRCLYGHEHRPSVGRLLRCERNGEFCCAHPARLDLRPAKEHNGVWYKPLPSHAQRSRFSLRENR